MADDDKIEYIFLNRSTVKKKDISHTMFKVHFEFDTADWYWKQLEFPKKIDKAAPINFSSMLTADFFLHDIMIFQETLQS